MSIKLTIKQRVALIFISWFSIVGFDLFLHAGLLARLYARPDPFLLSADKAFLRIPLGYLSFLILAMVLVWLMESFNISGWKSGVLFGLKFGALTWGVFVLGLYSISSAGWDLLLAWWIGQTLELGIAGIVVGAGIAGKLLSKITVWIIVFVVLMVILTFVLQAIGFASPMKLI